MTGIHQQANEPVKTADTTSMRKTEPVTVNVAISYAGARQGLRMWMVRVHGYEPYVLLRSIELKPLLISICDMV